MIVVLAVITTPGAASALKNKFLGRKKCPKNVEKETEDEKSEFAKLNSFLNQENVDCDSKIKFAQMVENLAKEKMFEIKKALNRFSNSKAPRQAISRAILHKAVFTKSNSRFNVADSVSTLATDHAKSNVATAIRALRNTKWVKGNEYDENKKVIQLLIECLKFDGAKREGFQTFQSLAEDYWIFEYGPEEMLKITDSLIQGLKFKNFKRLGFKRLAQRSFQGANFEFG